MAITATMVKELRERTGAGMMECKKMLTETGGDMEAAIDLMRKSGAAKADKKAGRVAADGKVVITVSDDGKEGSIVEVNCETDFVAKDENFINFSTAVGSRVLADKPADVEALSAMPLESGETVEEVRANLVAKIGENMQVRRFEVVTSDAGQVYAYSHGVRIGVALAMTGGDETLGKDIAMHIAASRPVCVSENEVPAETLEKEKEILIAQAEGSGKPMEIIEKMVEGRMRKYLSEITLVGQPFVKDPRPNCWSQATMNQNYKRILLKLSGEALMGQYDFGIDSDVLAQTASEVVKQQNSGTQVALVIGGGNIFRGAGLAQGGIDRVSADQMGMLATVMNALAMQDAIKKLGGTGNPYFTTDTAASLRAIEIEADLLLKATKVDGIYDSDPMKNPDAKRYDQLGFDEAIAKELGVMDLTAMVLCRENKMPLCVFNMFETGALDKIVNGDKLSGTLVMPE
ncbi:Elongation factor Ts [Nymphon striatum]|nr:Elongation factor Ts [Nymphon striatum]